MLRRFDCPERQIASSAKRPTANQDPAASLDGISKIISDADINGYSCLVSYSVGPKAESFVSRGSGDRHTSRSGWAAPARVHPRFNDFRWSGVCASRTYMPWLVSGAVALPSKTRVEDVANGRHYVDRHHENAYNASARCAYMPRADQSGVHIEGRQGPPTGVHVSALWFVIRRSI